MAEKKLFSGRSLQQAILAAARYFRVDAEEVAYHARTSRQGVVRGRERIVIEVDPAAPRRQTAPASPAVTIPPAVPPRPGTAGPAGAPDGERGSSVRSHGRMERRAAVDPVEVRRSLSRSADAGGVAEGPQAEAVQVALDHLARLAGLELEARIVQGDAGLTIDLSGPGQSTLVAEDARLLQAVDHLLPRLARGLFGETVAVSVDSGGLQERLHEGLRALAREAAARVKLSGQPEALPEMSPAERRIVHLTLADDPDLTTESLGGGVFKRVQVRPA